MEQWNATIELDSKASADSAEALVDALAGAGFSPAAGTSPLGRLEVILTVTAETLLQATGVALALVEQAGQGTPTAVEVTRTVDFDRRHGMDDVPDLVGVTEAAHILGVSRQRVLQLVDAGDLAATRAGKAIVLSRAGVEAASTRRGVVSQCNVCGAATRPGAIQCDQHALEQAP